MQENLMSINQHIKKTIFVFCYAENYFRSAFFHNINVRMHFHTNIENKCRRKDCQWIQTKLFVKNAGTTLTTLLQPYQ